MVIYAGKAEILERQVAQFFHRFVDFNRAGLYLFKKSFNLFRLNRTPTFLNSTVDYACPSGQPVAFASSDSSANTPAVYL